MTVFGSPTRIGSDVGALSSDEKRQYTMGLWRKAVARASSLDSRPKTDTTKLLLRALNENPYHKVGVTDMQIFRDSLDNV